MVSYNNKKYHHNVKDNDDIPARYCIVPVGEIMLVVKVNNIMLTLQRLSVRDFGRSTGRNGIKCT